MAKPDLGVSVIICCYNGASRLPQTLRHLALQQVPAEISWEIIIVDNASTDDTYTVASAEWEQYSLPGVGFKILSELKQSKYYALSKGVDNASYEYIIICDDDNWLNSDYVSVAYHTINSNIKFAAAGGQSTAVADIKIPDWFWHYQNNYAVGSPKAASGDISDKGYLWGAGMIFRRSLYKKVNFNLPGILLGPGPKEVSRSEDVELCMRFILSGYKLYYDEKLIFRHHIASNRLTDSYRDQLLNVGPYENRVLNLYRKQIGLNNLSALKKTLLLFISWLRYLISKLLPHNQRWHYAYEAEIIYLLNGFKAVPIADEAIKIRQLNFHLSEKTVA